LIFYFAIPYLKSTLLIDTLLTVFAYSLNMYVEDRASYNGPIQLTVKPTFTVAELKEHVQCEFEIPVGVQRWILGKSLAEDDATTLESHGINQSGQTIYLYLVAPKETGTPTVVVDDQQDIASSAKKDTNKKPSSPKTQRNGVSVNSTHKKGRYWNYEMDRWSFCSDDEEEAEESEKISKASSKASNSKRSGASRKEAKGEGDTDNDDYEWEYFYEGVEFNDKDAGKVKDESQGNAGPSITIPAHLKPLVVNPPTKATEPTGTVVEVIDKTPVGINKSPVGVNKTPTTVVAALKNPTTVQPPAGKTQRVDPRDGWECLSCTLLNEPTRPGCEACTTERPKDYKIPPPGPADTMPRGATATAPTAKPPALPESHREKEVKAPETVTKEKV
jgi:hypothetical protein